ncbi:HAD domain-containing protein [Paraburkholderia graminis]|uniref:Uncharacterized protein n=1 Tax=Paraburkholderia graminis TaxID=60548 RepID=A0ABD5CE72_9BURK|nr:HAD domain-containing protein [Paraburkholderia graminis]MDR6202139.1 hypothetical protein [Paraburkholderia graminis]
MNLYLNLDGVLHPNHVTCLPGCVPVLTVCDHEVLEHAPVLADVLEGHSNVNIVLNTWWTFYLGLDACIEMLPSPLACRVSAATIGCVTCYDSIPDRAIEMEKHIARQAKSCFIVLDHNNARYRPELLPHLLLLDPEEGLAALTARRSLARRLTRMSLAMTANP